MCAYIYDIHKVGVRVRAVSRPRPGRMGSRSPAPLHAAPGPPQRSLAPSLPPSPRPSPPASAELLRGCSRGSTARPPPGSAAAFGEERSGAGERHKREGRRESPSHAPLPQVYDGGPEEQRCSAATARLLKTCCSAFWVKLMLIVSFHCAFYSFFPPLLFSRFGWSCPAPVGGVCWGRVQFGEGLSSLWVPRGARPVCPPDLAGEREGWGRACVRCVPPFPARPLRDRASTAIVFPGGCGDSPSPGLLPGPPCPGSRRTAELPKARIEGFFQRKNEVAPSPPCHPPIREGQSFDKYICWGI